MLKRQRLIACIALVALGTTSKADIVAEAFSGQPFGVAHVTLSLDPTVDRTVVETNGFRIDDETDRVLYPSFSTRRVLGLLRDLVGTRDPGGTSAITAWFLFRGNEPFNVTVLTPEPHTIRVIPRHGPVRHRRMMERWWRQYTTSAKKQIRTGDYPPVVETYLTSMLSSRLRLSTDRAESVSKKKSSLESDLLRLLFNTESIRIDAMRNKMLSSMPAQTATHELPADLSWPTDSERVDIPDDQIESIARYVPHDWLYVRFGSFANYLWLTELTEQNGGDLGRMISLRGHDALVSTKMQMQLGLRETALSKLLGGQVISDLAVVGRDVYMREGAAIGVLFEAKNTLLMNDLKKQRNIAMKELGDPRASTETISIAGSEVSFASTPDNRMRSFFASRDNYHPITNSRAMVEQFLVDGPRLADSNDFRRARKRSLANNSNTESTNESAFIFLSRAFLRNLLSPHYQIELRRRLNSVTEMELLQLATLTARAEGYGDLPSDQLARMGFLPAEFGTRPDGSQLEYRDGKPYDSLRGPRGFFLPIPDMAVSTISHDELNVLADIETFQRTRWDDMDPVTVSIRRSPAKDNRERLDFDARLDTFSPVKYGAWASIIGPRQARRIVHPDDNVITAQASLQGGDILPNIGEHLVFLGMRDEPAGLSLGRGKLQQTLEVLRTAPAYLGAWPRAGLLDLLPIGRVVLDQDNAFERLPLGLWRWTSEGFSVISFNQDALAKSVSDLNVEEREETAQLYVHVGDLAQSKLSGWFRALNFQRAYEGSVGNTRFLNAISQQLRVPISEARSTAERVLDIRLTCPLDGEYSLTTDRQSEYWKSDAWNKSPSDLPDDFSTPLAKWFRGLDLTGFVGENELRINGTLEMNRVKSTTPKLPSFDFFKRPKP